MSLCRGSLSARRNREGDVARKGDGSGPGGLDYPSKESDFYSSGSNGGPLTVSEKGLTPFIKMVLFGQNDWKMRHRYFKMCAQVRCERTQS